jgi:peptide/nickel transport system substrate-binding protein
MRYPNEHVDSYRRTAGEQENHLIDEFKDGRVDRREFMRRGSVLGMGAMLTTLIAFGPEAAFAKAPSAARRRAGGTVRVGGATSDGSLEPPLLQSLGALAISHMPGEQLVFSDVHSKLVPRLAESWKPSADSKSWTFTIRQGVKFHDGTPLTTDDVVATFERLVTKDSQALSSLGGVLSPGGTTKVDASTVKFDLDAANGFFPYLLGQMTYQAIILPKTYQLPADLSKPGEWTTKMNGTGPFKLKENRGQAGLSFVANDDYWGGRPSIDAVEFQVLEDNARVAALRGGQVDIAVQISYDGARQLGSGSQVLPIGTANHRYLNMNVKKAPFKDVRVRTAIALALGRPQIAAGLWGKYAQVGNDSPLWAGYAFTDKTVPQRKQDLAKAKALLKAAGATNLKLTLTCYRAFEMPAYAQRVASDLKKIGITCKVKIYTSAQYFNGVSFGAKGKLAPWLSTDFGIVDYGSRPIPLTYLNAALKTGGVWNAARYANKSFDKTIANFTAASDLQSQKKYAKSMETQLLKDTPAIYAYFYNFIAGAAPKIKGYVPDGGGVVDLRKVTVG